MYDAPELSVAEREALIKRCPEQQRRLFRGWLEGTHMLDGDLVVLDSPRSRLADRLVRVGVGIGHVLGAVLLVFAPSLRPQHRAGNDWGPR
jgi:hypothetical protein